MKQHKRRLAVSVLFLGLLGGRTADANEAILFFSDFSEDDTGYFELWEEFSRPDPVELVWDPTRGSPAPGSLRTVVSDQGQAIALGQCLPVNPSASYRIQADVQSFSEVVSPPSCIITFYSYTEPDCNGISGEVPGSSPGTGFDWEFVAAHIGPLGDDFWFSLRAVLIELNPLNGEPASCNFDNVRISLATPSEVPAVGPGGATVFVAMVALIGAFLVTRLRR